MNWKRERPGVYTAGPYLVEKIQHADTDPGWYASGPGLYGPHYSKADAQQACVKAATNRISGHELTCEVHVRDRVRVIGPHVEGRANPTGHIRALLNGNHGPTQRDIWSVQFNVGKRRTTVYRNEIEVLIP